MEDVEAGRWRRRLGHVNWRLTSRREEEVECSPLAMAHVRNVEQTQGSAVSEERMNAGTRRECAGGGGGGERGEKGGGRDIPSIIFVSSLAASLLALQG